MSGIRVLKKNLLLAALAASVALAGCSSGSIFSKDDPQGPDYKRSTSTKSLAVPPDLTNPQVSDGMEIPSLGAEASADGVQQTAGEQSGRILPKSNKIRVEGQGNVRWLVVDMPPEKLWPKLVRFWQEQQGLTLKLNEPRIGIMETQWAENRSDIPQDFIRGLISKLFANAYSADTRDKFRTRMERGANPGTTEVYVTHYGVEEVNRGEDQVVWQPRESDPELADEMLHRMLVFLGVGEARAKQMANGKPSVVMTTKAKLVADDTGRQVLEVDDAFARAWRLVGIALDRTGLVVEDRNRSSGTYFVRSEDLLADADKKSKGFFASLFSSDDESGKARGPRYRIVLHGRGDVTEVLVQDNAGERLADGDARKVLTTLKDQLP
jgi:outer membrane protein assembly factor BamC